MLEKRTNLVECFIRVAPYINGLMIRDIAIAVTDTEKYLSYTPGKHLNHHVKPYDPLKEGSIVKRAMKSRDTITDRIDNKELFGVSYIGIAIPVIDEESNQVIGAVFFGENTSQQDTLREMASSLAINTQNANESSQEISAQAQELAALGSQLSTLVKNFHDNIKGMDEVMKFIKGIANQTNLLGLNASIEAARAGTYGLGFQVVAEEIRKLSTQSSDSTNKIQAMLGEVKEGSTEIKNTVEVVENISGNLASILQSISASLEEMNTMVEELSTMANNLMEKEQ